VRGLGSEVGGGAFAVFDSLNFVIDELLLEEELLDDIEEEDEQEEEEDNSDDEDGEGEDIEMREKRMITPLSSYNISPITPEDGSGNGSEPDAFSGVEPFSAF